jgi:AraC family transcriptional regulator
MRQTHDRQIEACLMTSLGEVSILTEEWVDTIDTAGSNAWHHLQLSLFSSSLDAVARYTDHWAARRFERVGALFLVPARHEVHMRSTCRIQRSIVCRLDPDAIAAWLSPSLDWSDRQLAECLDIPSAAIRRLMCRISDEMRNPAFASLNLIELLLAEIGIELSRHFLALEDVPAAGGLAPWRLRRIDEFLARNAAGATLADMAKLCNLSVRHLSRAFQISRGCTLGDYMAAQRIEQSRRMLSEGMSVKETAHAMGFTVASNFSASFRRSTGETPRQYQKRSA